MWTQTAKRRAPRWSAAPPAPQRPHASHKGSYGDVAVIGGAPGMAGAALLAARAACITAPVASMPPCSIRRPAAGCGQPDLMLRAWDTLDLDALHVACGCGGGDAVRAVLPRVLSAARSLVLDADALNAIAADRSCNRCCRRAAGARGRRC
jgi:NAD(P)H-hydrate repair Nnr-like enzyme with NAD(P)H-hydrate dehydratase domain